MEAFWIIVIGGFLAAAGGVYWLLRRRGYSRWLWAYVAQAGKRRPPRTEGDVHVLICIADHFEPKAAKASAARGQERVDHWVREYPKQFGHFRDSDGRP